ncbi:cyclophilin-like protein [Atractiella rhizophila]|nr:cyclophilin-like protein [Atractiella rhizophila]
MANIFVTEPIPSAKVSLETTAGQILIELWAKEIPKACRNFIQLCLEGYYDGCQFFRVVPNFIVQTGDRTNSGDGGESIFDEPFEDEFNQRLKFNRRGLVAMANEGKKNTNLSQFFITLDRADSLQGKNTIFGRVVGDTLYNVLKIAEADLHPDSERPLDPYTIRSVEVLENPFKQAKARKEAKKEKKEREEKKGKRGKGTKNKSLMSFEDGEGDDSARPPTSSLKSIHEAVKDERLDLRSVDDRALKPDLPPDMLASARKRKAEALDDLDQQKSTTMETKAQEAEAAPAKPKKKKAEPVPEDERFVTPNLFPIRPYPTILVLGLT